jgi:hypothetical protein
MDHHGKAGSRVSGVRDVDALVDVLAGQELVVVNVTRQWKLDRATLTAIRQAALAGSQSVWPHLISKIK